MMFLFAAAIGCAPASSGDDKKLYPKGNTDGIEGYLFQIALLKISSLNSSHLHGWKLSTENKNCGKFDDAVLHKSSGTILLQAKHKKAREIDFEQLTSTNPQGDFSLGKYFFSFQEIHTRFNVEHVIICTNAKLKIDDNNKTFLTCHKADGQSMLHIPNKDCSFYTFNDNFVPALEEHIRNYYNKNMMNKKVDEEIITDGNIRRFLKHLQLYCNYPDEQCINKSIEERLPQLNHFKGLSSAVCLQEFSKEVLNWFRQPKGIYWTELHTKAVSSEIRSKDFCKTLDLPSVFLFDNSKRVKHFPTKKNDLFTARKIYHDLNNKPGIRALYVSPNDDADVLKQAVEVFEMEPYTHLVLVEPKIVASNVIKETCEKIKGILDKSSYKNIFLLTKMNNEWVRYIREINNDSYFMVPPEFITGKKECFWWKEVKELFFRIKKWLVNFLEETNFRSSGM